MAGKTKRKRPYDSSRRREQAEGTRRQILEAAEELLKRDGYAATPITAIASEAGVSPRTVYLAFETKSGLLRALWNLRLRGDEAPTPVGERPWFTELLDEPDPVAQVRMYVHAARVVRERIGPLLAVIRDAAPIDRGAAELWERMQAEFHQNQRVVVESLHRKQALKAGLDVAEATDVLWTLNHPTVYLLLVHDRGWSLDRYEEWLAGALSSELLRQPVSRRPGPRA